MGAETRTHVGLQLDAATNARNYAQVLTDELAKISRDVDDLLHVWRGGSATAYCESWSELKEAVQLVIDDLGVIGTQIADAAYRYDKTDDANAQPLLRLL